MILYNVTTKIDKDKAKGWLNWMREEHIPSVMKTGLFVDYKICRLLGTNDPHDETFAVQYFLKDINQFNTYQEKHATAFHQETVTKYGNYAVFIPTLMAVFK